MLINTEANKPLQGIKVLDLSRILAGPWCTQQLTDFGADVIKVEEPFKGDDTRHWGPPFVDLEGDKTAAYFLAANRGKQSIALNLKSKNDYQTLKKLVKQADVVLHNFMGNSANKLKLDYLTLKEINPQIIYCSITGYGNQGSFSDVPGYDALIQAEAGLMHITGADEPVKVGVAVTDLFTGMQASQAIIAALFQRTKTGKGKQIEISLFDSQFQMLANQAASYLATYKEPSRLGTAHPNIVPYQIFQSLDFPFMLAVGNDKQFKSLCLSLELNNLAKNERCFNNAARVDNREWLIEILQNCFHKIPRELILSKLKHASVPAAPLQNFKNLFESQIVKERELVRDYSCSSSNLKFVAGAILMDGELCLNDALPPKLNNNHLEILQRWLNSNEH